MGAKCAVLSFPHILLPSMRMPPVVVLMVCSRTLAQAVSFLRDGEKLSVFVLMAKMAGLLSHFAEDQSSTLAVDSANVRKSVVTRKVGFFRWESELAM